MHLSMFVRYNTIGRIVHMQVRNMGFKLSDGALLRNHEDSIKFLRTRTTEIKYKNIGKENGRLIDIPVIQYGIFDKYDELVHGFSTRLGGVSREHLASMNLSFSRNDNEEYVMENHRRFAKALGYNHEELVFSDQVHDTEIHVVTLEDAGKGIKIESDIKGIDGLVTNERDIPLMTFYADCVPLYFYDPIKHVIALAHSGWKGTVKKIGSVMVNKMAELYDCNPKDIICAIGPSICKECYEVSSDVAERFIDAYNEEEIKNILFRKNDEKYLLDLHQACKYNFVNAGILEENIAMPDMCTCCNSNILFSHRATKGMRGNLAAVIMLKN